MCKHVTGNRNGSKMADANTCLYRALIKLKRWNPFEKESVILKKSREFVKNRRMFHVCLNKWIKLFVRKKMN